MARYVRSGGGRVYVHARDQEWLTYRVKDALDHQTNKIISNFQQGAGGWEGWLQFELMYSLTLLTCGPSFCEETYKPSSGDDRLPEPFRNWVPSGTTADGSYTAWKKLPEPKPKAQRVDFAIRVEINHEVSESHYLELKCKSSKESSATFVGRVKEDIEKVCNTKWNEWRTTESVLSAWVIAISIDTTGEVDELMHDAASEKGIKWHVIDLATFSGGSGEIKIWSYNMRYRGSDQELLFGYASQDSLQRYVQFGDAETREPSYMPDDN